MYHITLLRMYQFIICTHEDGLEAALLKAEILEVSTRSMEAHHKSSVTGLPWTGNAMYGSM